MIVHINSKSPRELYQFLVMAYSLSRFTGETMLVFQKKIIGFRQSSIKPRHAEVNVTMLATLYGSLPNQVQVVSNKTNENDNKMKKLMDLLCQMMAS